MTDLLRSKRFWSAVAGAIVMLLVSVIPDLEPLQDELITAIVIIVGVLIGGFSIQDAALAYRGISKYAEPSDVYPQAYSAGRDSVELEMNIKAEDSQSLRG